MRILIDLQACQSSGSRHRGIGRYSLALAKSMVESVPEHEYHLLLNAAFDDSVLAIRREFRGLIPADRIHVWHGFSQVSGNLPQNRWRAEVSEKLRQRAIAQIAPDCLHVSSLFEGLIDDAVVDVAGPHAVPTAVTLYDLIPFVHKDQYLRDQQVATWYYQKLQALKNAHLLLAISAASRTEAIEYLHLPAQRVANISSAVDARFSPTPSDAANASDVLNKYGLRPQFVMYTGGIDLRKNIERLIEAYASLPDWLRAQHQLAIVCSIQDSDKVRLLALAQSSGLLENEVVLTGFVEDEELPVLYRASQLFVFPSWHEGFGLPALEAMSCGIPVIASNNSSLPEVIGRSDALFDPLSVEAIRSKMFEALTNHSWLEELRQHAVQQAQKFSWKKSARLAVSAMQRLVKQHKSETVQARHNQTATKPRLAFVSPFPPEKTGIADYCAELLPELAAYYDIALISDQEVISDPWLKANFPQMNCTEFLAQAQQFDRVLYQIGNSPFHMHMFDLIQRVPGAIILHDFFLSNVLAHRDFLGETEQGFLRALYESHGYSALAELASQPNADALVWKFPANLSLLQQANGVIVHSQFSVNLAKQWYGPASASDWKKIPHLRQIPKAFDQRASKRALGIPESAFLICSFGLMGSTKLNRELLEAWINSGLLEDEQCYLVFVGANDAGPYGAAIQAQIDEMQLAERVRITGFASPAMFQTYLQAADLGVQLRSNSRGETSGTTLDCMAHQVPVIVNAHGTAQEFDPSLVWQLPDRFETHELCSALLRMRSDSDLRDSIARKALQHLQEHHAPAKVGAMYFNAIEEIHIEHQARSRSSLIDEISRLPRTMEPQPEELQQLARSITRLQTHKREGMLLVDVTTLAQVDAKSGIQRVVREILKHLLTGRCGFTRVEPVIVTELGLRYARQFTCEFLGIETSSFKDDLLDPSPKDVFLGLDLNCGPIVHYADQLQQLRVLGVAIYFVVYDILPVTSPQFFQSELSTIFQQWIKTIASIADGALCISAAVQQDLSNWLQQVGGMAAQDFQLAHFHLGADLSVSEPSSVSMTLDPALENALANQQVILMVGTVEPRKAHDFALDAIEQMWRDGQDVCLLIVGNVGWKTEQLIQRIQTHPEYRRRLFLLSGLDDAGLVHMYRHSACLLMASWGEGFGLPLIEASHHGLALVVRDLPVFREVCGDAAEYFDTQDPLELATTLKRWWQARTQHNGERQQRLACLTWEQSAQQLGTRLAELVVKARA